MAENENPGSVNSDELMDEDNLLAATDEGEP